MSNYEEMVLADIIQKLARLAEIIKDHNNQLNLTEKEYDDLVEIENLTSYLKS